MTPNRLVILGRDGTINAFRGDHVKSPDEWEPLPGALEAIARIHHAGWHVVVATNQPGIGRGMYDMASLNAVHAHMMAMVAGAGGRIDAVFFCPHAPGEVCECRKPLPGLLLEIGERYGVHMKDVVAVGAEDEVDAVVGVHFVVARSAEDKVGRAAEVADAQIVE